MTRCKLHLVIANNRLNISLIILEALKLFAMGAFTNLLIHETISIPMPLDKFEESLSGDPGYGFTIVEISDHEYKLLANFSLGTMIIRGMSNAVDGIKIIMTASSVTGSFTEVKLRSPFRIELIFSVAICAIILVALLTTQPLNTYNSMLWLFPFIPVWFWLVYRVQEYFLMKKIEKYLATL